MNANSINPIRVLDGPNGSHVDHGITREQLAYLLGAVAEVADLGRVTIEPIRLPEQLGTVPCALYGPAMGDAPVLEADVVYQRRGDRDGATRMLPAPLRRTDRVTVIVGPAPGHEGLVLYTAYGGPPAPREPWDPSLDAIGREEARAFWREHALATGAAADPAKNTLRLSLGIEETEHGWDIVLDGLPTGEVRSGPLPTREEAEAKAREMGHAIVEHLAKRGEVRVTTNGRETWDRERAAEVSR